MESISYTAARSSLARRMEQVCNDHAPIAITRKGEGAVVMMSMMFIFVRMLFYLGAIGKRKFPNCSIRIKLEVRGFN